MEMEMKEKVICNKMKLYSHSLTIFIVGTARAAPAVGES